MQASERDGGWMCVALEKRSPQACQLHVIVRQCQLLMAHIRPFAETHPRAFRGETCTGSPHPLTPCESWVHYAPLFSIEVWMGLLYGMLLRASAVPRALALVGLGTAALHFVGVVLPFYLGYSSVMQLAMPMGLSQVALVGRLVTAGFGGRRLVSWADVDA